MTRIALIASSFLPRAGGVEEHVANVALQLRELGHDVVVWATDQQDVVPSDLDGITLRYLPCPLPSRDLGDVVRFAAAAPRARSAWRRAQAEDRPEVHHVHCFGPNGLHAMALSRSTRTPLVLSHHGETFGDAFNVFSQSALLRRGLVSALRRAAAVTSCSRFAANDLARFGADPDAVEVVFNGINLDEPSGEAPPGLPDRYVLGVGRLVGNKGFGTLIRSFAAVANEAAVAGVGLVIGGNGPEREALVALAEELGIGERVHLPGRLSRPQVGAVMAGADVLAVPSDVEGFGITILEGWRAGIPVLATRRGGPPEFVEDGEDGILIDPQDVGALARRLVVLLSDPELRGRMGRAGLASVQRFTWRRTALQYQELYSRIGL